MRRDHLNTGLCQFSVKLVRVVCIVANQALDSFFYKDLCEGLHHQLHFMWRAFCADRYRKAMAVSHGHDLSSFSSLGFAHADAPFFAGGKLRACTFMFKRLDAVANGAEHRAKSIR